MEIRLFHAPRHPLKNFDRGAEQRRIRHGPAILADAIHHQAIGVDAGRAFQRTAFPGGAIYETALFVARVCEQKVDRLARQIEKFGPALEPVVERGKRPHETRLRPCVLVRADRCAVFLHAGQHAAILIVRALVHPKRNDAVRQQRPILFVQGAGCSIQDFAPDRLGSREQLRSSHGMDSSENFAGVLEMLSAATACSRFFLTGTAMQRQFRTHSWSEMA